MDCSGSFSKGKKLLSEVKRLLLSRSEKGFPHLRLALSVVQFKLPGLGFEVPLSGTSGYAILFTGCKNSKNEPMSFF